METAPTLISILTSFDKEDSGDFTEFEITTELRKVTPDNGDEIPFEVFAESMAFNFAEGYSGKSNRWGTYFGPMYVAAGSESPSLSRVTPEMIDYWENRAHEAKNPILKARYFGLIWDFSEKIKSQKPNYKIGENYVVNLVSIAEKKFDKHQHIAVLRLQRALSVSLQLNKPVLIERVVRAILDYDKHTSAMDMPGLWGHAFDLLVMNDKINVEEKVEQELVADLEKKLTSTTTIPDLIKRWDAEALTGRLAHYYRKRGRKDDMKRVLIAFGTGLEEITKTASAMQASGIYERIQRLYRRFGLNVEAEETLKKLRDVNKNVDSEMSSIPFEFSFSKEEFEKYLQGILEGSIEDILFRITGQFIPDKGKSKEEMLEMSKKAPTMYLLGHQIMDRKGRVVASIASLQNDVEGHVIDHISKTMVFGAIFIRNAIHGAVQRKNLQTEDIINFLYQSPIFTEDRKPIIRAGLDYYFANNLLVAMHLLIPQIEEAIRNIVEFAGGNVLKPNNNGTSFMLRTLDEILRDPITVSSLGDDLCYYFRILFTDQRGWNMRNNVCHGIVGMETFTHQSADRVLHALLCLGILRKKPATT